jgi:phosphoribosylglycinamide formyltransferase-1
MGEPAGDWEQRTDQSVLRLGVLVSGRGSNLEAVLEARIAGIDPVLVISNRANVRALAVAAAHGVPTRVLRRADFADVAARDAAIGAALSDARIDLALLAGYDQLLQPVYFAAYRGRTINIHPSLLPAHGGARMTGLAVHRSVLAAGDPETGATIHEVTPELDAGPILAVVRVAVLPGDDAASLAARVLVEEHRLLVATVARLAAEAMPGMVSATIAPAASRPGAGHAQEKPHA